MLLTVRPAQPCNSSKKQKPAVFQALDSDWQASQKAKGPLKKTAAIDDEPVDEVGGFDENGVRTERTDVEAIDVGAQVS